MSSPSAPTTIRSLTLHAENKALVAHSGAIDCITAAMQARGKRKGEMSSLRLPSPGGLPFPAFLLLYFFCHRAGRNFYRTAAAAPQAFPDAPDLHTHAIGCLGSIVASPDDAVAALAARQGLRAVAMSMRVRPCPLSSLARLLPRSGLIGAQSPAVSCSFLAC